MKGLRIKEKVPTGQAIFKMLMYKSHAAAAKTNVIADNEIRILSAHHLPAIIGPGHLQNEP